MFVMTKKCILFVAKFFGFGKLHLHRSKHFVCAVLSTTYFAMLSAPWMKTVWFFGSNYVIPNTDNVVLGGTQQKGDWNTTPDLRDTEKILHNIGELFPSLAKAPIVRYFIYLCTISFSVKFTFILSTTGEHMGGSSPGTYTTST